MLLERKLPPARQQAKRRGRIGRAAPDPGRNRQSLVEGQSCASRHAVAVSKRLRRLQHQIVPTELPGKGARHLQFQRVGRFHSKQIAVLGKGEQGLDAVIAVRLPRPDVKRQVDLGVGDLLHQGEASSGVRPTSILERMR